MSISAVKDFLSTDLKATERFVGVVLAYHLNDGTKRCDPSMERISEETGLCRRAIQDAVKRLEKGGHISVCREMGNRNFYKLHPKVVIKPKRVPVFPPRPEDLEPVPSTALAPLPASTGNHYAARDALLMVMGFRDYAEYQESKVWAKIRTGVLKNARNRCCVCGDWAVQVHHELYTWKNLSGADYEHMVAICKKHHTWIEFDDDEKKIHDPAVVAQRLRTLAARYSAA